MSYSGRASALLLLLSIPLSWLVVSLSGVENSPDVQITYGRYFLIFIVVFLLISVVLACIALNRKEVSGYTTLVTLLIAFIALLFFGWLLVDRIKNRSDNAGISSDSTVPDEMNQNTSASEGSEVTSKDGNRRLSAQATVISVNDWGSGFNVTFECVLPGSGVVSDFLITFNYSGNAKLTNGWMQSYGGGIDVGNIASDGGYAIKPVNYLPPLKAGDKLNFMVQGEGSGFNSAEFDARCTR